MHKQKMNANKLQPELQEKAEQGYYALRLDSQYSRDDEYSMVLTFDLQQNLHYWKSFM